MTHEASAFISTSDTFLSVHILTAPPALRSEPWASRFIRLKTHHRNNVARYQMPRKDMIEDIDRNICSKSSLRQAQLKNRCIVRETLWKTLYLFVFIQIRGYVIYRYCIWDNKMKNYVFIHIKLVIISISLLFQKLSDLYKLQYGIFIKRTFLWIMHFNISF